MKVLIVDDEDYNRKLAEAVLSPYGTSVMAEDGVEGVALFKESLISRQRFNLVLLDIMMPNMDGQQALKEMRSLERKYKVPVTDESTIFMVTAMDSPQHFMEACQYGGCSDYLVKPISVDILLGKLQEYGLIKNL